MSPLDLVARRLALAPTIRVRETLVRRVAYASLLSTTSLDFLYASGRPNRYNPAGVFCIYFSEQEETARLEYERAWAGLIGRKQPFVTFFAQVNLHNVLDLTDPDVLRVLRLTPGNLHADWRKATRPTKTQVLGLGLSSRSKISAIRYPSAASESLSNVATNLVIFRDQLKSPDYIRIQGPSRRPLQIWP